MSDLSDVVAWFEQECAAVCYPNDTGSPPTHPPITGNGKVITIVRGWPDPKSLDAAMAAGNVYVSIYPMPGMERNTTRYPRQPQTVSIAPATLTLTVNGQQVTVSGTPGVGQAPMITVGSTGYAYQVLVTDTLNSIATALAALIPGASAVGAVVTVPAGPLITVSISTTGTSATEQRRQERQFGIYVWASKPADRNLVASTIDVALAQIERFTLPDQFGARLIYKGTQETDELQTRWIYKRVLVYLVEYAMTTSETDSTISLQSTGITVKAGSQTV